MPIRLENRTGIAAPAEVIWEILADLDGWASWNPLYATVSGQVKIGSTWALELHLPNRPPRTLNPQVLDWAPEDHIHLRTKSFFIAAVRYFEIEVLSDIGCIFSNGEMFNGLLAPYILRPIGRDLQRGFDAMGEAMKVKAEAVWQSRAPAPTSAS